MCCAFLSFTTSPSPSQQNRLSSGPFFALPLLLSARVPRQGEDAIETFTARAGPRSKGAAGALAALRKKDKCFHPMMNASKARLFCFPSHASTHVHAHAWGFALCFFFSISRFCNLCRSSQSLCRRQQRPHAVPTLPCSNHKTRQPEIKDKHTPPTTNKKK